MHELSEKHPAHEMQARSVLFAALQLRRSFEASRSLFSGPRAWPVRVEARQGTVGVDAVKGVRPSLVSSAAWADGSNVAIVLAPSQGQEAR